MKPPSKLNRHEIARRHLLAHQFDRALPLYARLVVDHAKEPVLWLEYGNAAAGNRDLELADEAWRTARKLAPRHAELLALIGHQYQALRRPAEAKSCFAEASAADPRAINPRISLAVLMEQNHQITEARSVVDECLRLAPTDDQARYFAALLDRREGRMESAETRLRDLLRSGPRHPYVRYAARYELAQVLDRTERHDEAIRHLVEAKNLVKALTDTSLLLRSYDRDADHFRKFTTALPRDVLRRWASEFPLGARAEHPQIAFLGGHPRSGTTLLEQILDAHPEIAALDEPTALQEVLLPRFYGARDFSHGYLNQCRREYVAALDRELGPRTEGRLRLDKNPSPTSQLPLWLRFFPELKIVIALRDPRDVVLSCFFQNLVLNVTNVNFLSWERLARHYADLMDVWTTVREWEGLEWIESRYEDTVRQTDVEGRRVTEFLGLHWSGQQLRFFESSRQKQFYSPTYQDVTRPVYSRSVARWHFYERHLAPILPLLEPYCRRWGYS